ncbi:uncharacterized protein [Cherax quadricarinatus]
MKLENRKNELEHDLLENKEEIDNEMKAGKEIENDEEEENEEIETRRISAILEIRRMRLEKVRSTILLDDLPTLQQLLEEDPELAEDVLLSDNGGVSVHLASQVGRPRVVRHLITCTGVNPNTTDYYGDTALHIATRECQAEAVAALLECQADHTITDRQGWTAAQLAAALGHTTVLQELGRHDPEVLHRRDVRGSSLLHYSAANGTAATSRWLVQQGLKNSRRSCDGVRPHQCAQARDKTDLAAFLALSATRYGSLMMWWLLGWWPLRLLSLKIYNYTSESRPLKICNIEQLLIQMYRTSTEQGESSSNLRHVLEEHVQEEVQLHERVNAEEHTRSREPLNTPRQLHAEHLHEEQPVNPEQLKRQEHLLLEERLRTEQNLRESATVQRKFNTHEVNKEQIYKYEQLNEQEQFKEHEHFEEQEQYEDFEQFEEQEQNEDFEQFEEQEQYEDFEQFEEQEQYKDFEQSEEQEQYEDFEQFEEQEQYEDYQFKEQYEHEQFKEQGHYEEQFEQEQFKEHEHFEEQEQHEEQEHFEEQEQYEEQEQVKEREQYEEQEQVKEREQYEEREQVKEREQYEEQEQVKEREQYEEQEQVKEREQYEEQEQVKEREQYEERKQVIVQEQLYEQEQFLEQEQLHRQEHLNEQEQLNKDPLEQNTSVALTHEQCVSMVTAMVNCLYHTRPIRQFFSHSLHRQEQSDEAARLTEDFVRVIETLNSGRKVQPAVLSMMATLESYNASFDNVSQEDAQGMLEDLLQLLHLDLLQVLLLQKQSSNNSSSEDEEADDSTVISEVFQGIHRSFVTCLATNTILSTSSDTFSAVSVSPNPPAGDSHLQELLERQYRPHMVLWECWKCGKQHQCSRFRVIIKLPQVLVVKLSWPTRKRSDTTQEEVTFPSSINLTPFMKNTGQEISTYRLYAACGDQDGSFSAYCRKRNSWYAYQGAVIRQTSLPKALSGRRARLLFYDTQSEGSQMTTALRGLE